MKNPNNICVNIFNISAICVVFVFGFITIVGSGSSGGSSAPPAPVPVTGQFIDSAVEGLNYQTPSQSGLTGSDGSYNYVVGETSSFAIGDVFVGQTEAHALMTPICLVSGATNEMNPTVTNITSLLQSLDLNGIYNDGITLTDAIRNEVEGTNIVFEQSIADFQTDPIVADLFDRLNAAGVYTPPTRALMGATTAQNQFRTTLTADNSLIACLLSPACSGTGIADAATYNEGVNDPHLIILINSLGDAHEWNTDLPTSWRSTSVSNTQLVACVGDQQARIIQECRYYVPEEHYTAWWYLYRMQYELEVVVVEAQTGVTVGTYTLLGGTPASCPPTQDESWPTNSNQYYYGSPVSLDQLLDLLDGIVNP